MKEASKSISTSKEADDTIVDSMPDELFKEKKDSVDEETNSLEMIKRGIKGGLSVLEKQMDLLSDQIHQYSDSDLKLDNLTHRSLGGVKNTLENLNELVNLIQDDTVSVIKNMELQAANQWTLHAHLQTLVETLKKNNLINEKELEKTWNEFISEANEQN